MSTTIPIVVAIVTAFGGFIAWLAQRRVERRETERLRKQRLYEKLLESIVELSSFGNGAPLLVESQRAWLYASDEVLMAVNDYLKVFLHEGAAAEGAPTTPQERVRRQQADARIRLAIRRDLQPTTRLDDRWITEEWKPVASSEAAIREYLDRRSRGDG